MKSFNISIVFFSLIFPVFCMSIYAQNQGITKSDPQKTVYGESFEYNDVKSGPELVELYEKLEKDSAAEIQISATVSSVCQVKGCWMELELANGKEARVTFKDYGFFVPTDLVGKNVVVNGIAHIDMISEEDQKHYAEDAGKSAEEIRSIQGSLKSYSLVAEGVVIED
ncbi:MAG: DUF4920 domain-containing protein [Flavobacteriaceae bacterium]